MRRTTIPALLLLAVTLIAVPQAAADGPTRDTVSNFDVHFARAAAQSDVFEIRSGRLALARSQNAEVRTMANHIIRDHTLSSRRLKAIARAKGLRLPTTPAPLQRFVLEAVGMTSGPAFDMLWTRAQVRAHEQTIMLFADEVRLGYDPHLRAFARAQLPVLRMHLAMAREALAG